MARQKAMINTTEGNCSTTERTFLFLKAEFLLSHKANETTTNKDIAQGNLKSAHGRKKSNFSTLFCMYKNKVTGRIRRGNLINTD